jgi:D-alanine-D-alanine ligase
VLNNKKIAVLRGGWSAERAVSLVSGRAVLEELNAAGYKTRDVIVEHDAAALLAALTPKPDIIFNALHGNGGEDGVIQGFLEILGVPYTHSGVAASAMAMNKALTKDIVQQHGVYCAKSVVVTATPAEILQNPPLPYPFVIKPVSDGSSVDVFIIHNKQSYHNSSALSDQQQQRVYLVEAYIAGRELTVPVLGGRPLTVIEITPQQGFYDYTSKYDAKQHADFTLPAPIPRDVYSTAQYFAVLAHNALGCKGVSRSDFRYNPDAPLGEQLVFLEINTQPGMTALSLTPTSAQYEGISFLELIETLLKDALTR